MAIDYDLDEVSHTNPFIAFVHLMASARTVKAILVYVLLGIIIVTVFRGEEIPQMIEASFFMIVGTFFDFVRTNVKNGRGTSPTPLPSQTDPDTD